MKIQFLGGAGEVGSLGMLLEIYGDTVLFDYGFTPTDPPAYPEPAPRISQAFLTHAHIDHSGMMPWLSGRYGTSVITTPVTADLAVLLSGDSIKIAEAESYVAPFDNIDVNKFYEQIDEVNFDDIREIGGEGTEVRPRFAGHIPGAAMFEVSADKKLLFTGDINTVPTNLVGATKPYKCDILVCEGTYAGREHPDRDEVEKAFVDKVDEIIYKGGKVIIPAFAVGRSQEVILLLRGSGHEIWQDGMGRTVNEIMLDWPHFLRNARNLRKAVNYVREVYSQHGRTLAMKGDVIVTTSGMLDGGPVVDYIYKIRNDPNSAVLLTGYQVEGCNGRNLKENGVMDFHGVTEKVNCQIDFYDLSAHSGHSQLVDFIKGCDPEKVILCHSDNREAIAKDLEYEVLMPNKMEEVEIK
jgi:putative mRNA 3-end processing factor